MRTAGILLAGGIGSRVGGEIPKQFMKVGSKSIMEYSLENMVFSNIDEIYIVIHPEYKKIGDRLRRKYDKVVGIIESGRNLTESIYNGLKELDNGFEKVVINASVRPFIIPRIYNELLRILDHHEIVTFCSKITALLTLIGNDGYVYKFEDRDKFRLCGTPTAIRGYLAEKIVKCVNREDCLNFVSLLHLISEKFQNLKIYPYVSEELNLKITYQTDIKITEILLKNLDQID